MPFLSYLWVGSRKTLEVDDLGDVPGAFNLLEEIVDRGFPIKHIRPMHVARKKWLLQDAIGFARKGGFIDVTSGGICDFSSPADAVEILFDEKVPPHLLTMSTDGHGSKPSSSIYKYVIN